ncbi:MAG: DDE-type integrase/transposase/recombinase [archaeon]
MKKVEIRREFFKLKNKGHSYAQCRIILKAKFNFEVNCRTLKRYIKRLDSGDWDLMDKSTRPNTLYYKVTLSVENEVLAFRAKTGWGSEKILQNLPHLNISTRTIDLILNKHNLCRETKNKGKRKKWVRWQRDTPNSLWQIDHTDEMNKSNCYTLSVLDDASRYSLALVKLNNVTTKNVTLILDLLIKKFGKPKQILTDNGSAYGGKNKHSKFDRWCKRNKIQHIRTKAHSPTTNGKVERLFKTMDEELEFCNNDLELFRMRYNQFRPHSSLNNKSPGQFYNDFSKKFNW